MSTSYPLTEQETIDMWYDPSMHSILTKNTGLKNYVVLYKDHALVMRLHFAHHEVEIEIPEDAKPGLPWPALLVTIKLNA